MHRCVLVRTARARYVKYHETLSPHTPAMKEWVKEVASSSECQKDCPKERTAEYVCVKKEGRAWITEEFL